MNMLPGSKIDTMRIRTICLLFVVLMSSPMNGAEVSFNREIRSILSENCFACHGPDKNSREADLRLDDRTAAIDFGAIVPGDPDASAIIQRIESDDDTQMPPPDSGKKLTADQRKLLRVWISEGARYEQHWAFQPLAEEVHAPDDPEADRWSRSDLDRFVFARLKAQRLQPAAEAGKSQWLRRVCLDLTGLPPTLEQLDEFLASDSEEAYAEVVNRLLASHSYGERMASMWLDVARYADTFGYQNDVAMEVWPWRDWVIQAFNENLPYDKFVLYQTAGDLLPDATGDQKLATAFNRLHRQTNEGGSVPEEFRQANIADRTATNATAFLGLTFECARCHDHKYDPILQEDFYKMSAYFANIDELGLYSHFTFAAPTPALLLYEGDQEQQHQQSLAEVAEKERVVDAIVLKHAQYWLERSDELIQKFPEAPQPDLVFPLDGGQPGVVGESSICNGDDAIACEGALQYGRTMPVTFSLWLKPALNQPRMVVMHQSVAAEDSAFRGMQLTIDDGYPEFSLIHFWPGNALRVQANDQIPVDQWTHLAVTYDGSSRAEGVRLFVNGRLVVTTTERDQLTREILHLQQWHDANVGNVGLALGARFRDHGFRGGLLDDLQVFHRQISDVEVASIYAKASPDTEALDTDELGSGAVELTDAMRIQHHLFGDRVYRSAYDELLAVRGRENEIMTGVREIMTMKTAMIPRKSFILHRGAYDAPADEVEPGTPSFLAAIEGIEANRLGLARWMIDRQNPLVSRVAANRFWHLFFGRGLVASLDDFGSQGRPPSHPELLDWLARRFIDSGWDIKSLCREIVLSATYRQSSVPRDASVFVSDPANELLSRGPRYRLSAEQIRDVALAASGLLVPKIGGPSVMPYQPAGLWEEAGTGKRYTQAKGEGLYRRSLYTYWKRTAPPPSMLTFDATSRETCTAKRELTATPLQALVLLNDPQYVEASRVLAGKLMKHHADDLEGRWVEVFRRLVSRPPTDQEKEIVSKLYQEQLAYFNEQPESAAAFLKVGESVVAEEVMHADLAATTVVVETLLNYDETMMKR